MHRPLSVGGLRAPTGSILALDGGRILWPDLSLSVLEPSRARDLEELGFLQHGVSTGDQELDGLELKNGSTGDMPISGNLHLIHMADLYAMWRSNVCP